MTQMSEESLKSAADPAPVECDPSVTASWPSHRSPRGVESSDSRGEPPALANVSILAGGGELGVLIRTFDWSKTPLGPIEQWSPSLKMMVSFLLANRFPLLLWWGSEYISIYNDAYRPILGTKHPDEALGKPVRECWSEIWHILKPLIDAPFQGGPATWIEDIELELHRSGFKEESHFTIAYSPVPDDTAPRGIGGVLATVHEITEKVIGERRITTLRNLGARSAEARTADEACVIAAEVLEKSSKDVPFAIFYLLENGGQTARLAAATGLGSTQAPSQIPLGAHAGEAAQQDDPWALAESMRSEAMVVLDDLSTRLPRVSVGPWSDPPHQAVVVPLRSNTAHQLAGFLVAGVSSRLRLSDQYRSFFELAGAQIATVIASARAYEAERARAEALAQIDQAKTTFFSNVSHEFRTPLDAHAGTHRRKLLTGIPALRQRCARSSRSRVASSLRLLRLVKACSISRASRPDACGPRYEQTELCGA